MKEWTIVQSHTDSNAFVIVVVWIHRSKTLVWGQSKFGLSMVSPRPNTTTRNLVDARSAPIPNQFLPLNDTQRADRSSLLRLHISECAKIGQSEQRRAMSKRKEFGVAHNATSLSPNSSEYDKGKGYRDKPDHSTSSDKPDHSTSSATGRVVGLIPITLSLVKR